MKFFSRDWSSLILFSKIYMETSDVTQLPEKRNEAEQALFLMFEKSMILRAEKIVNETGICDYLKKGEKCLDIGTGMGYIAKEIAGKMKSEGRPIKYVVGIDNKFVFSPNLRNGNNEDGLLKFVNADAKELPFSDKSFDNVTFFFSFHHMSRESDIECSLREALRVLKDNGKIFVAEDIVETGD
ncbi:MAG TPA: class I SAM-dependent methyltransferase [Candidatus Moranbacteria bacterium]|nr:class I SAM-dependent methyltransferase [Candidatus Moranbacteria bacterium]